MISAGGTFLAGERCIRLRGKARASMRREPLEGRQSYGRSRTRRYPPCISSALLVVCAICRTVVRVMPVSRAIAQSFMPVAMRRWTSLNSSATSRHQRRKGDRQFGVRTKRYDWRRRGRDEIGKHAGFRCPCSKEFVGSSPTARTSSGLVLGLFCPYFAHGHTLRPSTSMALHSPSPSRVRRTFLVVLVALTEKPIWSTSCC
jgi:hypothetical protein